MNPSVMQGLTFGRLTVIDMDNVKPRRWLCQCVCGNKKIVMGGHLRNGHTVSCGCFRKEVTGKRAFKHGDSHTATHSAWSNMRDRCNNEKNKDYLSYGGRGIHVCERWNDYRLFVEDMGYRPDGLELDRVDNNNDYCKENCRWADRQQQMRNQRRSIIVEYQGERFQINDLADRFGISQHTLKSRIHIGWSIEDAISKPIQRKRCSLDLRPTV